MSQLFDTEKHRGGKRRILVALVAGLVFAAGIVLSGAAVSHTGRAATATTLDVRSTARNACSPGTLTAPAGAITIVFTNPTDDDQSFGVIGHGIASPDGVRRGESSSLSLNLAAGSYTYWCGDDRDKAMKGTLTVTSAQGGGTTTAGTSTSAPPAPASIAVTALDNSFSPTTLRASAGQVTVTVTNNSAENHTFTVANLVNLIVPAGQTKTATFTASAGTYKFFCAYHGSMTGTLTIDAAPGSPPPPTTTAATTTTSSPPPPASSSWSVTAKEFSFTPNVISAPAGTVTLTITNAGQLPHTFTIDGLADVAVGVGETKTVSFQATAGTYRIYCNAPGHASAGMTGTLLVAAPGAAPPPVPPPAPPAGGSGQPQAGPGTATAAVASTAVVCAPKRVGDFVIEGVVRQATQTSIVLTAKRTTALTRLYRGKVVSVAISNRTTFTGVSSAIAAGVKPGALARVTVGRCTAHHRVRVATKVALLQPAGASSAGGGTVLALTADSKGIPAFDRKTLEAPAGKVTLRLTNPSPLEHNISILGHAYGKTVGKDGVSTITAVLKRGTYKYFCTVPGHATAGMTGVLTVK